MNIKEMPVPGLQTPPQVKMGLSLTLTPFETSLPGIDMPHYEAPTDITQSGQLP